MWKTFYIQLALNLVYFLIKTLWIFDKSFYMPFKKKYIIRQKLYLKLLVNCLKIQNKALQRYQPYEAGIYTLYKKIFFLILKVYVKFEILIYSRKNFANIENNFLGIKIKN